MIIGKCVFFLIPKKESEKTFSGRIALIKDEYCDTHNIVGSYIIGRMRLEGLSKYVIEVLLHSVSFLFSYKDI